MFSQTIVLKVFVGKMAQKVEESVQNEDEVWYWTMVEEYNCDNVLEVYIIKEEATRWPNVVTTI